MINKQTLFDEEILDFIITRFLENNIDYNLYIKNKLFIDLGNSNAKLLFNSELYTIGYENIEFELLEIISEYLDKEENKKTDTFEIYYSNVKKIVIEKIGEYLINQIKINYLIDFSIDFINVRDIIDSEIVKKSFNYQNVKGIGTDRLLGLYLAYSYFPKQTNISIDFGTAITINIIDKIGNVLGGQILPGLFLQLNSLNLNTAGINLVNSEIIEYLEFKVNSDDILNNSVIGTNTQNSVLNGIFSNIIGSISSFLNSDEIIKLNPQCVMFTGSYSEIFYKYFYQLNQQNNFYHSKLLNLYSILLLSCYKI